MRNYRIHYKYWKESNVVCGWSVVTAKSEQNAESKFKKHLKADRVRIFYTEVI